MQKIAGKKKRIAKIAIALIGVMLVLLCSCQPNTSTDQPTTYDVPDVAKNEVSVADLDEEQADEPESESTTENPLLSETLTLEDILKESDINFGRKGDWDNEGTCFFFRTGDFYRVADNYAGDTNPSEGLFESYDVTYPVPVVNCEDGDVFVTTRESYSGTYSLYPVSEPLFFVRFQQDCMYNAEEINGIETNSLEDRREAIQANEDITLVHDALAVSNEVTSFTYGKYQGTKWMEETISVDQPGWKIMDEEPITVSHEKTKEGYFIIDLSGVPSGMYAFHYSKGMGHASFLIEVA